MSVYQLKNFGDLVRSIRNELGVQSTDTTAINRIKEMINVIYAEVVSKKRWWWLDGEVDITLPAYTITGTASISQNTNIVTLSLAPPSSKKDYFFALDGYSEIYRIESHAANSTTVRLANTYTGNSVTDVTFRIWSERLALPTDCKETIDVSHDFYRQSMENVGRQEFNRVKRQSPRNEAKPLYYFTGDYVDPTVLSSISGLPAISTRSSALMIKTIVFANSIPLAIATSVNAGEAVQWNVAKSGHPSYNGNVIISSVSTTSVLNDTITYTGLMEYTESAIADSNMTITNIDQEQDYNRYRELYVYPALSPTAVTLHVEYSREALPLNNDSDEPLVPFHDRISIRYGALSILWSSIGRNPEEAARNKALYDQKINQMESKWQDSTESAILRPSKNYLGAKRNLLRKRSSDLNGGPLITGGAGGATNIVGLANTVATYGTDGILVGSATVSTTELGYLDGVTSAIQTQLDGKTTDLNTHMSNTTTHGTAGNIVGTSDSQTLTNKSIDADSNTITNIENADIKAAAAIALNKLAATTVSRALVSDASGFVSPATTTSTEIGYVNGVTSAIQTQLDAKIPKTLTTTTGDIIYASSANTPVRLGIGSTSQVLTVTGGVPVWASPSPTAPTIQKFTSGSGTYTRPTGPTPLYIRVRMVGAGGGGAGSGTTQPNGTIGVATTFGGLAGSPGAGATAQIGGTGGAASGGNVMNITGGTGGGGTVTISGTQSIGGYGGHSALFSGGGAPQADSAGSVGTTNTGGGGAGGSTNSASHAAGGAGGAGGYVEHIYSGGTLSATFSYAVGSGGAGGAAGAAGFIGAAGGSGYIEVTEYYQ